MFVYITNDNAIDAISPHQLPLQDGFTEIVVDDDMFPLGAQTYLVYENGALVKKTHTESEALALVQEKQGRLAYKVKRVNEYPPIADYLDGVVKGDQAQIDAYIAACQAVKAKYPKPE